MRPLTLLGLASIVFLLVRRLWTARRSGVKGVPWVGRDDSQWFAELRANLSTFKTSYTLLHKGYTDYNKNGKTYMIPDMGGSPQLVLPTSQLPWFLEQPDNVLSASGFHYDTLAGDYCFDNPEILRDPYHERAIHRYLPRRMAALVPDIQDEVSDVFDTFWGRDTKNWKEVNLWDCVLPMVSRTVNRVLIGLPLCRNDEFLKTVIAVAESVPKSSLAIAYTPRWLRPIAGPLITWPQKGLLRKLSAFTKPIIEEQLARFQQQKREPDDKWTPPNDFISWHIQAAMEDNRPEELDAERIAARIVPIEFAAIHTTSISFMNCMLDLISSQSAETDLERICVESSSLLQEHDGHWTKSALGHCHLADSALRESMRLSGFMSRNVTRKVIPSKGITNPFEGWNAPQGVHIGFDQHNVHHDADYYTKPMEFDAFRFAPATEAQNKRTDKPDTGEALVNDKAVSRGNTDLITTSDIWFPFSRGRHTCPGRFLVAAEIKIFLAYMTMNYDVETLQTRPANKTLGAVNVPGTETIIKTRRKEGTPTS